MKYLSGIDIKGIQIKNTNGLFFSRNHYITSESQLPVSGLNYLLTSGKWIFDTLTGAPLVISKPLELANGSILEIVGDSFVSYTGTGAMIQGTFTSQTILTLTSIIFIGAGKTGFSLSGNSLGVLLGDFVQFIAFSDIGSVTAYDTIVMSNMSFRTGTGGLTITNLVNYLNLNSIDVQGNISNAISLTGTGSPSVNISGVNFIPTNNTNYCVNIENTLTPNVIISNSIFDRRNVTINDHQFLNPAGFIQTSIYINLHNVKNVEYSNITSELIGDAVTLTTITTTGTWTLIVPPANTMSQNLERITVDTSTGFHTVTSLENAKISISAIFSLESSSGTLDTELAFCKMIASVAVTSIDTGTNFITKTAHGLLNDQIVRFTAAVMPAPLLSTELYYVVNKTIDTFQVSRTIGGAAIDITTAGTTVLYSSGNIFGAHVGADIVATRFTSIGPSGLVSMRTGDIIYALVKNNSSAVDYDFKEYYIRIN